MLNHFQYGTLNRCVQFLIFLIIVAWANVSFGQQKIVARPNIILILADDMGYSDIGCFGSEIMTPNIDQLAKDGITFTQFYNAGRCCPSRASILTGQYSHSVGVGDMTQDAGLPAYRGGLNKSCATIAQVLKTAGYRTYIAGKWHVGDAREQWPLQRGFDRFYGSVSSPGSQFSVLPDRKLLLDNTAIGIPAGWYATNAFTDYGLAFMQDHIKNNAKEPFFLYMAYTAPHFPVHGLPEDMAKYTNVYNNGWEPVRKKRLERQKQLGIVLRDIVSEPDPAIPAWSTFEKKEDFTLRMMAYAAMVDRMDQNIGRLVKFLKENGLEKNTLVMFLSDNGASAEVINKSKPGAKPGSPDSYVSYEAPWANVSNVPFRKYKIWVHEGGISTPLIIKWPAGIKQGLKTSYQGHVIDILPTLADIAGAHYPAMIHDNKINPTDGKSFLPVFSNTSKPSGRPLFWEHEGNRAVRNGKWKLVAENEKPWELYDMSQDREESHDLSAQYPKVVAQLTLMYNDWAKLRQIEPWSVVESGFKKKVKAN